MDRLAAMQVFVRVVETGSFSAVAREVRSTQSAVSKQVAALERLLGARLLTRTTRSLALTEAGTRYFAQARRLIADVAEVEATVRSGEQQLAGWLRVAASVGFGRLKLLPLVRSFLALHPAVKVDLRLHDGFTDLVEQGIDLAVRIGELEDSTLLARRIGWTHRALLAHPSYLRSRPRAQRTLHHPDDLLAHDCVVYSELSALNAWTFVAGEHSGTAPGTRVAVRVQGNLQTNSSEVVREAVLAGMGIGYAPTWLFEREIAKGSLQVLLPQWAPPALPIQLVSPPHRHQSAKARAFGEHVADAFR